MRRNLKEVEVDIRSDGQIKNKFETLPRKTVLSLSVLPTVREI